MISFATQRERIFTFRKRERPKSVLECKDQGVDLFGLKRMIMFEQQAYWHRLIRRDDLACPTPD
jgi:hypothetical protein